MVSQTDILSQLENIIERLQEAVDKPKNEFNRDATIKRFELAFDLSWKSVKWYLEYHNGIICKSPKKCFREAYLQNLVKYDEEWIDMTNDRNNAAHLYKESWANELYKKIPTYLTMMQQLAKTLDNNQE